MFGTQHVRATLQEAGRQAIRHLHQLRHRLHVGVGQQLLRQIAADQQAQGVTVLKNLAFILRDIAPRRFDRCLRLSHFQSGRTAQRMAASGQLVAFLLTGQRVFGEFQKLVVGGQGQPAGRHFGDQADLRAAPGFGQRQVILERFVLKVLDTPEHIQLIAAQAQLRAVLVADRRLSGHRGR